MSMDKENAWIEIDVDPTDFLLFLPLSHRKSSSQFLRQQWFRIE